VGETVETSSGLKYRILQKGEGNSPVEQSQVKVHYRGRLEDGTEFDSSYKRGQPATFPVNGVIRGWTEALMLMKPGDKWELTIPPELGYGSRAVGNVIPPDSTLIFEVELLEIL
jgi:FKBP-type peptidyl-prolyl cis-trans isomerase